MDAASSTDSGSDEGFSKRGLLIFVGVVVIGLFVLLDDVMGLIEGGGISSVISALQAAQANAPMIDVDGAGLRSLVMTMICVTTLSVCGCFNLDLKNRARSGFVMFAIVGAGFAVDAIYDETVLTHALIPYGYTRCPSRDHDVGNGKSKVWFHSYVLSRSSCVKTAPKA